MGEGWPVMAKGLGPLDVLLGPGEVTGCQVEKKEVEREGGPTRQEPQMCPQSPQETTGPVPYLPPRTAQVLTTGKISFVPR